MLCLADELGPDRLTTNAELTKGRNQGVFRAGLVPNDAAVFLIALVQGLALRWSLGQRAFSLEAEGARLLATQIGLFRQMSQTEETA